LPILRSRGSKATLCLCLLLSSTQLFAADSAPGYTSLLLDDIHETTTAPTRWQPSEWNNLGWASLSIAATITFVDAPWRDEMRRQPQGNVVLTQVERLGAEYSIGVIGGFYLAGSLTDNETAHNVAQDGLTASIIASGLITPALKITTGRSRPYENTGSNDFLFLGAQNRNSSFPSGHTTEAFALASVISAHYEETWVKATAYTTASLVGLARTYHDAHFASDVLAGALIGTWVGQSVVSHNKEKRGHNLALLPETNTDSTGLHLTGNF
jgi:hypothetical protein